MWKKFWFFWFFELLPPTLRVGERVIQEQWNASEVCAHKSWPLHTVILPPAFFACSHCPKHSQLPSFVQSLRAHSLLLSLQLELRTSRCYQDAQDLGAGWKVTASVSLFSQCTKICNLLSVAGKRLPWQRPSWDRWDLSLFEGAETLGIATIQLSWDQTCRSLKIGQVGLGCHSFPKKKHLPQPQCFAGSCVFNAGLLILQSMGEIQHTQESNPIHSLGRSRRKFANLQIHLTHTSCTLLSDSQTLPVWLVKNSF